MSTQVKEDFGEGAANITDEHGGQARVVDAFRDGIDDVTDLRTQFTALLAKLDADTGVADTDYASSLALGTQNLTKG
jgi:hypothetical protein